MTTPRSGSGGRPRSDRARTAILWAVDDLLVEGGYRALTMKGIAQRAGVGRQTVYRWWSNKAEVLFEAALTDAAKELVIPEHATTLADVVAYVTAVDRFLAESPAGIAYRALVGEAQHDPIIAALLRTAALFDVPTRTVLTRGIGRGDLPAATPVDVATRVLTGPVLYGSLAGARVADPRALGAAAFAALRHCVPQ